MPLDPQAAALLENLEQMSAGAPKMHEVTPDQARAMYAAFAAIRGSDEPLAGVEDRGVPLPDGTDLRLRCYRPEGDGALPVCVFFHGGGWVLGDLESHDALCRSLASRSGCTVVAVDYRLSPEHPFPGPLEDCLAALRWVVANGGELGVDPGHLAVAGDSAGGNLAAATCLVARDEGGPPIDLQLLVYPVLVHHDEFPSRTDNAEGYFLTGDTMRWFSGHYLADPEDATNPLAAPLMASDLRGLPAAHVITAEYDPLRDEAEAYATELADADVPVTLTRYDGMIHGFASMAALLDQGDAAVQECADVLREALKP